MIRKNLIAWQYSDYPAKHQHRMNLLVHIIAVPLFWVGCASLIAGILSVDFLIAGACFAFAGFALQAIGHKMEQETPTAFEGFGDFASRFITEQFINFPRFLFSGKWLRAWRSL